MSFGDFPVRTRQHWHARPWKDYAAQDPPQVAYVHHGAESDHEARSITTWAKMYDAMRGIQNFHMDGRGWADVAYHYVVFQKHGKFNQPNICVGRPVNHVPAAQLNHNTGTLAICVYGTIDEGDPLENSTSHAIAAILRHHGIDRVGGHRDVTETSCPGDMLYHALDGIARHAGIARVR